MQDVVDATAKLDPLSDPVHSGVEETLIIEARGLHGQSSIVDQLGHV